MGAFARTPVYYACQGGHLDVVQYLVEKYQVDVRGTDQKGMSLLMNHLKSSCNNVDLVKYLVEKGCDVHCRYQGSGATLFHVACAHGGLDIVKYRNSLFVRCKNIFGRRKRTKIFYTNIILPNENFCALVGSWLHTSTSPIAAAHISLYTW